MNIGSGDMDNLTMRHIRLFLAAARFENFSTAARYMYMTQPMVSRIIAGMEAELGVKLFLRGNQRVELTPAGRELAQSWSELIEAAEAGIRKALAVQKLQRQHIAIGNDHNADRDMYFYPITTEYISRFPDLDIDITHSDTEANIEKLRKGRLDFVYAMLYDAPGLDESLLTWRLLKASPLIAYVPQASPLFSMDALCAEDLRGQPILLLAETVSSGYTAAISYYLRQNGIETGEKFYLSSMSSINYNLYQGKGIFICNAFVTLLHKEVFKAFPLERSKDGLIAIWRKTDIRPSVLELVEIARSYLS